MAENSSIEWTDHTFNPWIGCQAVSPACDHCYAEKQVQRYGGDFATRRRTSPANWRHPLRWNAKARKAGIRQRVFCASLADVFDNQVPEEWRHDLWLLIAATPHLDWMLLTKRPQNIAKMLPANWGETGWANVWLGTTVENQREASRRLGYLQSIPAAKHFLSCEPLLEDLDLTFIDDGDGWCRNALTGNIWNTEYGAATKRAKIDLVICGGESGSGFREMNPEHARSLRDQCAKASTPFFMKQMSGTSKAALSAIPTDLQIREMPFA